MADKSKKENFFVRFGKGFVKFFAKIGNAFKNMWHELKKVTWPTREEAGQLFGDRGTFHAVHDDHHRPSGHGRQLVG